MVGEHGLALGVVILAWWASTAAVMRLAWQTGRAHRWSLAAVTALAIGGALVVWLSSRSTTVAAAYLAFGGALALWAWHELTFLLGRVTGPRREPCPPEATGLRRFRLATATVIHHELALAATLVVLAGAVWSAPNQVALWTFAGLWALRLSAKLNLFAGVAHVSEELVPPRLRYLVSYFRRRRGVSGWLLASIALSVAVTVALAVGASGASSAHDRAALSLLAALGLLGVLEHLFLAFPMQDAKLWRWVLDGREPAHEIPVPAFAAGADDGHDGGDDG